jgi:aldehyde dehydrogenase (NAD+)
VVTASEGNSSNPPVLIGGKWISPAGGERLPVIDPSDGHQLAAIARGTAVDIDAAISAARAAADGSWGSLAARQRGRLLGSLATAVSDQHDELALLEARDTGKPLPQAQADIAACAGYFEYYAGAADKVGGTTIPTLSGHTALTLREPHGVTGHILAWNAPAQMFGRTLAPALAMGNATVLKPAEQACLSTLRLAQLVLDVGFPPGALNVVTGLGAEAGAALSAHPGVDHLSFTGSPEVGSAVQRASAAFHRPVTLELGGKSPHVVFADADIEETTAGVVSALVLNAGQTCSAGTRLLVERRAFDEVVGRVAERLAALTLGRFDTGADCGPLISAEQRDRVQQYIDLAVKDGLPVVTRKDGRGEPGRTPDQGYFVAPSLVGPVPPTHRLAQEEIFGPVLVAIPFDDEADAVRIANGTPYGLVAGVWTADGGRQLRLARALRCGQVFVNNYGAGGGVELPFGGVKRSGFGREKGMAALDEYSLLKSVVFKHS